MYVDVEWTTQEYYIPARWENAYESPVTCMSFVILHPAHVGDGDEMVTVQFWDKYCLTWVKACWECLKFGHILFCRLTFGIRQKIHVCSRKYV